MLLLEVLKNADDDNVVIHVTTKSPNIKDFNRIIPNIPAFVNTQPRCYINQQIKIKSGRFGLHYVVKDYLDEGTGSFILKRSKTGETKQYGRDQFAVLLKDYYSSDSNVFSEDINRYLGGLVSAYESQVEQMDTNQSLDKPNAIILRIIKIKQQVYRLLDFISDAINVDDETFELIFSSGTYDRLLDLLSSIAAKERSNISNTSIHKVNKPLLQSEDIVRVKYWPNNDKTLEPSWEKGTIISCRSYTEHEDIDGYGSRRVYSVKFDNGDLQTVEDYQVTLEDEYLLSKRVKESDWKGVKRVVDKESSDPWAREVGWYVATCTCIEKGVKHDDEQHFVYLSDALRAYVLKDYDSSSSECIVVQFCMLQVKDRLSDPIMRRICRILLELIHPGKIEHNGAQSWNMALGHYTDGNTKQMRDSVYKFALSKQCKVLGSVSMCSSYCGTSDLNISHESCHSTVSALSILYWCSRKS